MPVSLLESSLVRGEQYGEFIHADSVLQTEEAKAGSRQNEDPTVLAQSSSQLLWGGGAVSKPLFFPRENGKKCHFALRGQMCRRAGQCEHVTLRGPGLSPELCWLMEQRLDDPKEKLTSIEDVHEFSLKQKIKPLTPLPATLQLLPLALR